MLAHHALHSPGSLSRRVHSAADLCRAVAADGGHAGHLDDSGLNRILCHDVQRGALEVQAGTAWDSLAVFAGEQFLPGTVGDGVAANTAGPDGRPMVEHLRSLTLVTGDGELRRASRELAPELFGLVVGGCGAFGPLYSATLDLASLARAAAHAVAPVRLDLPPGAAAGTPCRVEVLVPPQSSEHFIAQARTALEERRCALTHLDMRLTLPEHETFLRWARRDYAALRLEFRARATLGACVGAAQQRLRLFDLALAAGGTLPPGQLPHASRAQAAACYPMLGAFLAEKHRYDPAGRVHGAWYRQVRDLWRREACAVRWSRG